MLHRTESWVVHVAHISHAVIIFFPLLIYTRKSRNPSDKANNNKSTKYRFTDLFTIYDFITFLTAAS